MKTITLEQLRTLGACRDQIREFKRLFGSEVRVTVALARKHVMTFNWNWAAEKLLSSPLLAKYDKVQVLMLEKYSKSQASLWVEYMKANTLLFAKYQNGDVLMLEKYEKDRALHWVKYEKTCEPLLAKYKKVCAAKFAALYLSH